MKVDTAGENHARVISQRAAELDFNAAGGAKRNELRGIVSVMFEYLQTLHNERCEQFKLFLLGNATMNAGRKDHRRSRRRNAKLGQPSHKQVNDLRTRSRTCRIGHDDQYGVITVYDFIKRRRTDGLIECCADLKVRQALL
jgi:hypothetical protein